MKYPDASSRRVLLVDDDPNVLTYLSDLLSGMGYAPLPAEDEKEAMAVTRRENPALAIIDIVLGKESGVKLAQTLIDRRPDLRVLLISGYADMFVDTTPASTARTFFLRKAFSPGQLKAALETMSAN